MFVCLFVCFFFFLGGGGVGLIREVTLKEEGRGVKVTWFDAVKKSFVLQTSKNCVVKTFFMSLCLKLKVASPPKNCLEGGMNLRCM